MWAAISGGVLQQDLVVQGSKFGRCGETRPSGVVNQVRAVWCSVGGEERSRIKKILY